MCLLKWLFVPLMKLYVREARGFENIPKEGPAILIANHLSNIDAVMIRYLTEWHTGRAPVGIQAREWIEKSWLRKFVFITLLRQIMTNGSVQKAVEALVHGKTLMIFPEGARSPDGKMQKCTHKGLGVVAEQTGAQVIPIGISGTFEWWPRHKFIPHLLSFKKIRIKAGKPIKYSGKPTKKDYLAFQKKAMQQVAKLAKTKYPY